MKILQRRAASIAPCLLAISTATAAEVLLTYDANQGAGGLEALFFSGNWDPETGAQRDDWNGFARFPMFDDGTHGDQVEGDGIWSVQQTILPAPMATFQWAVDQDQDGGNGWLGTGENFRVLTEDSMTVPFFDLPNEARLSAEELEAKYGVNVASVKGTTVTPDGEFVVFIADFPEAEQMFIAGSFNAWAENNDGVVSGPQYRMYSIGDGRWVRLLPLPHGTIRYKFVLRNAAGEFHWNPDPTVELRDPDNNTVLDLRTLMPERYVSSVPGRALEQAPKPAWILRPGPRITDIRLGRTWVGPTEEHRIGVVLSSEPETPVPLTLRTTRDLATWESKELKLNDRHTTLTLAAEGEEVPIIAELWLGGHQTPSDRRLLVLPVTEYPFDDLRYGFYSNWNRVAQDYGTKSEMLADLLLNAIEYYDYFPAHGKYAPTEDVYEFEPFFGNKIYARDIKRKMESDRERGILAIAYVAAYAASKSIYEKHPYPMTTADGDPRVFNGRVLPEKEADANGEEKWFWLMAIARDTPWYQYIMEEFRRTLTDDSGDLVAFDGFEIDSYGHAESERYYSEDSAYSGQPLADVIALFIEDVWRMAHRVKENVAVSFNCVCEFGISQMYDITDFIFIENWAGCKAGIEETVDICYRHRAPTGQRVVLKMYPPDAGFTDPAYFPADHLRLMMGMCITGGGSLMIAGEPNERTGEMHALNTLYYPSNVAIPQENTEIIRTYNEFDAMLYGLNHGRRVKNYEMTFYLPGTVTRGFENPAGDITVMVLNNGKQMRWDAPRDNVEVLRDVEAAVNIPAGRRISSVHFASPDAEEWMAPVALDFEVKDGFVRLMIPELHTLGAIILKAE